MSDTRKDVLKDCLSKGQDGRFNVLNVKYFRGSNDEILKDQLRDELCAAAARKRSGEVKAAHMPKWRGGKVDLNAMVAKL